MSDKKIKVLVKKFKIPIRYEGDEVIEEITDYTDEHLVEEKIEELEGALSLKLPNFAKEMGKYNKRQIKFALVNRDKNYIFKKIVSKYKGD